MSDFAQPLRRATRLRARGSILIMVVALLVLLALMGTAYIASARLDRYAAPAINETSSADVLRDVEGNVKSRVLEAVESDGLLGALYDGFDTPVTDFSYGISNDAWLSERTPMRWPPTYPRPDPDTDDRPILWRSISSPLQPLLSGDINVTAGTPTDGERVFESPYQAFADFDTGPYYPRYEFRASRMAARPSSIVVNYPTDYAEPTLRNKTRVFPALELYKLSDNTWYRHPADTSPSDGTKYLAADADGDGIADAGLARLLEFDGVTYYYATRIIDNNSTINVNTAWARDGEFAIDTATPGPPADHPNRSFFTSSVGLLELLHTYDVDTQISAEMEAWNRFRFGWEEWYADAANAPDPLNQYYAPATPYEDENVYNNLVVPNGRQRTDFVFGNQNEAKFMQLDRRLQSPGWAVFVDEDDPGTTNVDENDEVNDRRYDSLDADAGLALANRFIMVPRSGQGLVDTYFGLSAFESSPNYSATESNRFQGYPANASDVWSTYFDYDLEGNVTTPFTPATFRTLRPLLSTDNAVSNQTEPQRDPQTGNVPHEGMLPYNALGRWHNDIDYPANSIVVYSGSEGILPTGSLPTIGAAYFRLQNPDPEPAIPAPYDPDPPPYRPPPADLDHWAPLVPAGIYVGGPTYAAGQIVRYDIDADPAVTSYRLFVARAATATVPTTAGPWYQLPESGQVANRASLNTAIFPELWRAFWNVFVDEYDAGQNPFKSAIDTEMAVPPTAGTFSDNDEAASFHSPYVGNRFGPEEAVAPWTGQFESGIGTISPPVGEPNFNPARMLRSPLRIPPTAAAPYFSTTTPRFTPNEMMKLRAAIAAVNAEDLRDNDYNVTARRVQLEAVVDTDPGAGAAPTKAPYTAIVYGAEAQPYITEVFAHTDNTTNTAGYVAIELYNPYPFDISLANWRIAVLDRTVTPGTPTYSMALTSIADFSDGLECVPANPVVPANGYLILENYTEVGGGSAIARPASTGLPATGAIPSVSAGDAPYAATEPRPVLALPQLNKVYVPNLSSATASVLNHEMVLLKPRTFHVVGQSIPALSAGTDPTTGYTWDEAASLRDLVPVDSFDFTGLALPGTVMWDSSTVTDAQAWHYSRQNAVMTTAQLRPGGIWHFVYPGRYDAETTAVVATRRARLQGTQETPLFAPSTADEWDPAGIGTPPPYPGAADPDDGAGMTLGMTWDTSVMAYGPATGASNENQRAGMLTTHPLQVSNLNQPSLKPLPGAAEITAFPFGGFVRNGDVLHVPFIGSYLIMNAAAEGAAQTADAGTVTELNPITMDAAMAHDTDIDSLNDGDATVIGQEQIGRFVPISASTHYDWAADIFDYFTAIQSPHEDFLPNVRPESPLDVASPIHSVSDTGSDANAANDEREAPVQGLVNVNTAPWKVLAALPLAIDPSGAVDRLHCEKIAKDIVTARSTAGAGPFRSLFHLVQRVPTLATMDGTLAADPGEVQGDLSPGTGSTDLVLGDYEQTYLQVMRLSNLLTVKSDSFTCYLLVQGWRNIGTTTPMLVNERRSAFVVDRSGVATTGLVVTDIPAD